jgi:hypothetical protein
VRVTYVTHSRPDTTAVGEDRAESRRKRWLSPTGGGASAQAVPGAAADEREDFLVRLPLRHNQQHVAVGHFGEVVVRHVLVVVEFKVPDHLAVPGELLNPPAGAWAAERHLAAPKDARAQQVAVLQQVGAQCRSAVCFPGAHDFTLHVDEVRLRRHHRGDQGIALNGSGIVDGNPELRPDLLRRLKAARRRLTARGMCLDAQHPEGQRQNGYRPRPRVAECQTIAPPLHDQTPYVKLLPRTWGANSRSAPAFTVQC